MTAPMWPVITGTGHRDLWASLTTIERARLTVLVDKTVRRLRDEHGVTIGISGMAVGFDTILARAILDNGLKLWAYRPGLWQADRWSAAHRREWEVLCERADVVKDSSDRFSNAAYHARDRSMFDTSDVGVTCWFQDRLHGGTYQTLKYAVGRLGLPVIHIDPSVAEEDKAVRLPSEAAWRRALGMEAQPTLLAV